MTPRDDAAPGPVRTCIGCRKRAAKRELLRVVAGPGAHGADSSAAVVPDPGGTAPGRGAHLHPTLECFELAERRRAFARALRHDAGGRGGPGPLSLTVLREYLTSSVTDQPR
ncbi:YlxR family protein [Nocardioides pocheonensis]|uniref:YlxR family protein n=1 Tax=Nocardioides pocheonensis TaxID=661485 RepID=A0A3N0GU11_9ACTN|nr:YlxR family protein [Nocardioides pocheonensis]RNM15871.1 YlxR family protein [Nocardioides pocheonensis]